MTEYSISKPKRWYKLIALAERLGVDPLSDHKGEIIIGAPDGDGGTIYYDAIELMNAFLDRMERSAK